MCLRKQEKDCSISPLLISCPLLFNSLLLFHLVGKQKSLFYDLAMFAYIFFSFKKGTFCSFVLLTDQWAED